MYTEYSCGELWTRLVSGDLECTVNHMSVVTLWLTYSHTFKYIC